MLSGDGRLIICCNSQTMLSLYGVHANFRGLFCNLPAERPHFVFLGFWLVPLGIWMLSHWLIPTRFIQLVQHEAQLIIELLLQFVVQKVGMQTASCPPPTPLSPKRDGGDKNVRSRCFLMKTHPGDTDSSARLWNKSSSSPNRSNICVICQKSCSGLQERRGVSRRQFIGATAASPLSPVSQQPWRVLFAKSRHCACDF